MKISFIFLAQLFGITENWSLPLFIVAMFAIHLDYVITEKHPSLNFNVEGYLVRDGNKTWRIGTGHLEHLHGDAYAYACVLNMDFEISPQLMNINWPGKNIVQLKMQTILKKEK